MRAKPRLAIGWMLVPVLVATCAIGVAACGDDNSPSNDRSQVLEESLAVSRATEQSVTKREFLIDGGEDASQEGDPHTTQEVIDTFERADVPLATYGEYPEGDVLRYPEDLDENRLLDLVNEYGAFAIAVGKSRDSLDVFLTDDEGNAVQEEEGGIYWRPIDVEGEQAWVALKRYENVFVVWGNQEKQIDERWDRVNAILEQLPQQ
jgi:hypothetical protein